MSDAGSIKSFIEEQSASDDDEEYAEAAPSDDGQEDTKAQFAAAYDVTMGEIFDASDEDLDV
jgi:hypothetical protein